jgi:hypothetical protein
MRYTKGRSANKQTEHSTSSTDLNLPLPDTSRVTYM